MQSSKSPDLSLPAEDIVVVHRSDGSGTTFIWTSYLSHVSPEWKQTIGAGKSIEWTVGLGAPENEGISNTIKSTPNSIGIHLSQSVSANHVIVRIRDCNEKLVLMTK